MIKRKGVDAVATNTLAFSWSNLTAAIWSNIVALGKWLLFNPVGQLIVLTGVFAALVVGMNKYIKSAKAQAEYTDELNQEFSELTSKITELNSELEATQNRIDELNGKETLTVVEEAELTQLHEQNKELDRELKIRQSIADIKAREIEDSTVAEFEKTKYDSTQKTVFGEVGTGGSTRYEQVDAARAVNERIDAIQSLNAELSTLRDNYEAGEITADEYTKREEELTDSIKEHESALQSVIESVQRQYNNLDNPVTEAGKQTKAALDEILDAYNNFYTASNSTPLEFFSSASEDIKAAMTSVASLKKEIDRLRDSGAETNSAGKSVGELQNEYSNLIGEMRKNEAIVDFIDMCIQMKIVTDDTDESIYELAAAFIAMMGAANNAIAPTQSLSEWYKALTAEGTQFGDSIKVLSEAYDDLSSGQEISIENTIALLDQYPELMAYYDTESKSLKITKDLLEEKFNIERGYSKESLEIKRSEAEANLEIANSALAAAQAELLKYQVMLRNDPTARLDSDVTDELGDRRAEYEAALSDVRDLKAQIDDFTNKINILDMLSLSRLSTKDKSSSSFKTKIAEFREAAEELADIRKLIDTKEAKLDLIDENDIDAQKKAINELIELHKKEQNALHKLNAERRTRIAEIADELRNAGFEVDYDSATNDFFVKNIELLKTMGSTAAEKYNDLIEKAEEYNEANVDGSLEWWNIQKQILEYEEQIQDARLEHLKDQKDLIDELIDLEKERIEQKAKDMVDAYEKEKDAFSELIDMQKEMLDLKDREREYEQDVEDKVKKISKLQAKADMLSLDDSRSAQAERAKLLEEIAELQKELDNTQRDYSSELRKDALDKEEKEFEKSIDNKIEEIEDFLDQEVRLIEKAYENISQDGANTFEKLTEYCKKYTDTSSAELQKMWDAAMNAAAEYGSLVSAIGKIAAETDLLENGSKASATNIAAAATEMKENSAKWLELEKERNTGSFMSRSSNFMDSD